MLSKRYESTKVDRRTRLHVHVLSGSHLYTTVTSMTQETSKEHSIHNIKFILILLL